MNAADIREIFRRQCEPLAPVATGEVSRGEGLEGIRAVLVDVYGTLVISASGDIGLAQGDVRRSAAEEALAAAGIPYTGDPGEIAASLQETIARDHEQARGIGIEYPEVEIRDVWRRTIGGLGRAGRIDGGAVAKVDLARLATEFEVRTNPVWPMPGAAESLERLRRGGMVLGIVSNAQFYTPEMLAALFGAAPTDLGFSKRLQYYSYRYGRAKPDRRLFDEAAESLRAAGIAANEAVYLGNDMLNDVWGASRSGFRTALFAGDARSLRRREDLSVVADCEPDLVIADWGDLPWLVGVADGNG